MDFRRSGHRDERRRRVLIDELIASPDGETTELASEPTPTAREATTRRYSAAAEESRQPPITCLIPARGWTLTVLALGGLAVIAGLQSLYAPVYQSVAGTPHALPLLDVEAEGSLAAWVGSSLLLFSAAVAVMVFWLRSHKLNDYRGRYRLWLAAAAALLLGSLDVATNLHGAIAEAAVAWGELRWGFDAAFWTNITLASLAGMFGLRMAAEMRACRGALAMLALAAVAFVTTAVLQSGWLLAESALLATMTRSTCWLIGVLSVALSVLLNCRFVFLDAQGRLGDRADQRQAADRGAGTRRRQQKTATPRAARTSTEVGEASQSSGTKAAARPRVKANGRTIRVDGAHADSQEPAAGTAVPASSQAEKRRSATTQEDGSKAAEREKASQVSAARASSAKTEADAVENDTPETDPETGRPLSKAERRRLRKIKRRQAL